MGPVVSWLLGDLRVVFHEQASGTDYVPLVAAIFSAVAAGASWAAVAQTRRQWRRSEKPSLHGQGSYSQQNARVEFAIANSGPGIARGVGFAFVYGDAWVRGFPRTPTPGFLLGGEQTLIHIPVPQAGQSNAQGVVTCQDSSGNLHAWNLIGDHKEWKREKRWWWKPATDRSKSGIEVFAAFYPETNLSDLQEVKASVPKSAVVPQHGAQA